MGRGTSADGLVAAVISLEVCGKFFKLWLASLGGNDTFFVEDDCLSPLHL